jgi:hypothetical protein
MRTSLVPTLRQLISPRSGVLAGALGLMLAVSLAHAGDATVTVSAPDGSRSSTSTLVTKSKISYTPVFAPFYASGAAVLLNGAVATTTATSIVLDSTVGLTVGDIIQVGAEKMQIVAKNGDNVTLTVTRGVLGTTAGTPADNAAVNVGGFNQLNGAIDNAVTTIVLDDTTGISVGDTLQIQAELLTVTAVTNGTTLTVATRVSPTAHPDNVVVKLLSPGKATFDVVFSEAVYPSYLDNSGGRVSTTLLSAVFDGFIIEESDTTGGNFAATTTWLAEQVDGKTFKIYVTSINANCTARLTVDPTKFIKSSSGTAYSSSSVSGKAEFIETTVLDSIAVVQDDFFGFLNAPTVIGSFGVPAADATVNVTVDNAVTPVKVDTIGANADWTYAPSSAVAIGRHTYKFAGKDPSSLDAGGAVVKRVYYVWNAPTITAVKQVTAQSSAQAVGSSGTISFNIAQPLLEGLVGLPDAADAAMSGDAAPEVKVDIYLAGTLTPACATMTAHLVAGDNAGDSAKWSIRTNEWTTYNPSVDLTTYSNNQQFDVVLTMRVVDANPGASTNDTDVYGDGSNQAKDPVASLNTQQSTRTMKLVTSSSVTLNLTTGGAATHLHRPPFGLTFTGTGSSELTFWKVDSLNNTTEMTIGTGPGDGTLTETTPGTQYTYTPGTDIPDGVWTFYAKWTDAAGNNSYVSDIETITITTPSPTIVLQDADNDTGLAGKQTANHFPTFVIAGTNVTLTNDTGGSENSDETLEVWNGVTQIDGYVSTVGPDKVFTPKTQLPDGDYSLTAKYINGGSTSVASTTPADFSIITPTPKIEKPVAITGETIKQGTDGDVPPYVHDLSSGLVPRFKITDAKNGTSTLGSNGTLKVYALDVSGTPMATAPNAAAIKAGTLLTGTLSGSTWTPSAGQFIDKKEYYLLAIWEDQSASNGTDADGVDNIAGNSDDNASQPVVTSADSNIYALRVINDVEKIDSAALTFARPLGTGAEATTTIEGGIVTAINISNGGSGYTAGAVITLVGGNPTSAATLNAPVLTSGVITSIPINSGGTGYSQPPIVVITPAYDAAVIAGSNNTFNTQSSEIRVHGTSNRGATIKAYRNGSLRGTKVLATDATTWDFDFLSLGGYSTPLGGGANLLTFTQTDLCGVTSAISSPAINVYVDAQTPNPPVITSPVTATTTGLVRPVFQGTAQPNTTITLAFDTLDNTPADGDLTSAETVTTNSSGKWTFTPNMDLTAGNTYTITAVATSPSGLVSASSTGVDIIVATPALTVTLAPLAKGGGSNYEINDDAKAYAKGASTLLLKTGSGSILVGDVVTINTSPVTTATVKTVLGTTSAATQITISPGLAAAIPLDAATNTEKTLTIEDQPAGPAADSVATSLAAIKLTATFTEADEAHPIVGGNDVDTNPDAVANITTKDFLPADFTVSAGSKISSLVKGTGLVGGQPTNVWTLTVTPATSGTLSVGLDSGMVQTTAGKYISDFTVTPGTTATAMASIDGTVLNILLLNPGAGYSAAPTVTISGGGGTGAVATATVLNGRVTGFTVTNAGSGYTSVPTVTLSAPTGTGYGYTAVPKITIAGAGGNAAAATGVISNGVLSDVTVDEKGWGFTGNATITATAIGTGAVGTAVVSGGAVTGVTVNNGGTGYTAAPAVWITSGYGARATATLGTGTTAGKVIKLNVAASGEYFTQQPTVSFFGGGGTGAAATANISGGKVVSFTITAQGSGYTSAPDVFLTPTGSGATATAVLGSGATATKVASFTVSGGSGYTAAPKVIITSGLAAAVTPVMQDYTVLYNTAATTYTKPLNRVRPLVSWTYPADSLLPAADPGTPLVAGKVYYGSIGAPAKVRLNWSSDMSRDLLATDLQVSAGVTATLAEVDPSDNSVKGDFVTVSNNKIYDITLTPGSNSVTTMTVLVKTAVASAPGGLLTDTAEPHQTNLASIGATVKLVASPSIGPKITCAVGAAAPSSAAKTPTYPCTIVWPTPVSDFDATDLMVTNGVITKFAGAGTTYSFTVTPGEGLLSVQFDHTMATVHSVTGAAYTESSNLLTRLLDSTQPTVTAISSPAFKLGSGSSVTATVSGGEVTGFTALDGGSGYEIAPAVTISSGEGATGTVVLASNGTVASVTLTEAGQYYTQIPTVAFTGGTVLSSGTATTAVATISGGKVTGVVVTPGTQTYTVAPTVTLTSGGTGATADATVAAGVISEITLTAAGSGYTAAPTVIIHDGVQAVDNSGTTRNIPVRVTFSEAPKAFPSAAVVASAFGKNLVLKAPNGTLTGPQPVDGTGNRTWEFILELPTAAMVGDLRLVVPSQAVQDTATNPSQASGVYDLTIDLLNGTPVNMVSTTYSDG